MPVKTKHIVVGAIACVTITGAVLYWQFTKLMENAIKFAGLKIKTAEANKVSLDLMLTFTNPSDIKFDIISQEYQVFLNDVPLAKITNSASQHIAAKSVSPVAVNVAFNPAQIGKDVKKNAVSLLTNILDTAVRVEVKIKIGLWFFKVAIPYTYKTTLKDLLNPPQK